MKIAFYLESITEQGGSEKYFFEIAQYCIARKHTVFVFIPASAFNEKMRKSLSDMGANLITDCFVVQAYEARLRLRKLWSRFCSIECDRIYFISWQLDDVRVALFFLMCRLSGYKDIGFCTQLIGLPSSGTRTELIRKIVRSFRCLPVMLWADPFVVASHAESSSLKKQRFFYPRHLTVIHNGIDTSLFVPSVESRISVRQELKISDEDLVLIHPARLLYSHKGQDVLIKALALLPEDLHSRLYVWFLGDGGDRAFLESLAKEVIPDFKVSFLGWKINVERYLQAADIFAQPSRFDPCPFAVLEAMGCALPAVASRAGGIPELLGENNECGILVPPGEEQPLSKAIETLCYSSEMRVRMGQKARERATQYFTAEIMFEKTLSILKIESIQ